MYGNRHNLVSVVARVLLGVVFLFSAVTKAIDPYGTVLKIGEYLHAMGAEWATGLATPLAVVLIGFEMLLGGALVLGAMPRLTSRVAVVFMSLFTLFTLWVAVANPVAECGCFGDVIRLTNWQTFGKNVALTALAVVSLNGTKGQRGKVWSAVAALTVACGVVLFSLYGLVMLPVVDRFPFGVGVNIAKEMAAEREREAEATLVVCRNVASGEELEFDVNDSEWWNEEVWEFVRIKSPAKDDIEVGINDFRLAIGDFDITDQILMMPACHLLCVERVEELSARDVEKIRNFAKTCMARGERIVIVTTSLLRIVDGLFGGIEKCNMDAVALRALLRAPAGVVTLRRGEVTQKVSLAALR